VEPFHRHRGALPDAVVNPPIVVVVSPASLPRPAVVESPGPPSRGASPEPSKMGSWGEPSPPRSPLPPNHARRPSAASVVVVGGLPQRRTPDAPCRRSQPQNFGITHPKFWSFPCPRTPPAALRHTLPPRPRPPPVRGVCRN
jgi:hypothetical protein